jgi:hypothetical protein
VLGGFGVWCAARRLNVGCFAWPRRADAGASPIELSREQFDALVLGLPWQRLEQLKLITRVKRFASPARGNRQMPGGWRAR